MKQQILIGLCIIIALLISSQASAIGIVPAGQLFEHEPGKVHTIDITVINSDNRNMKVSLYSQGDHSDAVMVDDRFLTFTADEKEKKTKATFVVPQDLEPGLQTINIVAAELPGESTSSSGNMITATTSVISQLRINVPYPGLYAKAEMVAGTANADEPVGFQVSVLNAGSNDINEVYADISIFGPTNEKLGSFQTDTISIDSKDEQKLTGAWVGPKHPGKYFARATVHYDGKSILVEKVFEVGQKTVSVKDIIVESYRLGSIAKVIMEIENNWNQNIKELYGQVNIIDKQGSVVSDFKTITIDIEAFSIDELEGFWDTTGLSAGEYDMKIDLYYDGSVTEHIQPIYLGLDEVKFLEQPGTGMVIGQEEPKEGNNIMLLTLLVIILIVVNVGLFVYFKKFVKKK